MQRIVKETNITFELNVKYSEKAANETNIKNFHQAFAATSASVAAEPTM